MKKTILTLIVCCICGLNYAEEFNLGLIYNGYNCQLLKSADGMMEYVLLDKSSKHQVKAEFYSAEDFSLVQIVDFEIQAPETDSIANVRALNNKLLLISLWDEGKEGTNECCTLKMYDINGTLIHDFGKSSWLELSYINECAYDIHYVTSNKLLFVLYRSIRLNVGGTNYNYDHYRDFYHLTITSESGTQNVQVEKKAAFPCPARGEVNIPTRGQQGDLRVLNINGQVLDAQRIQEGNYQRVNTESYPAGTYIYQAGNETGKFMVE